ncbi:hypothetical protein [Thermoanaerobacterium sp. RBIITD]|nr:hypothetical protein [Thermoanaerobacterium sp. RBIITD]SNX54895.1 uridine kinase [Thermoanaerobacterium sp. RBIITD]
MIIKIDGMSYDYPDSTTLEEISLDFKDMYPAKIVAAKLDNEIVELTTKK